MLRDEFGTASASGGDASRADEWEKCRTDTAHFINEHCFTV